MTGDREQAKHEAGSAPRWFNQGSTHDPFWAALSRDGYRTLSDPAVKTKLLQSGAEPAPSTAVELAALLKSDSAKWARVVKAKNVKPD